MAVKFYGTGRVVADAEVKELKETKIIKFTLATDRQGKSDETSFLDCFLFSKSGKIAEFLKKGKPVFVEGEVQQERWESKDGEKRSKIVFRVENLELLGGSNGKGKGGGKKEEPAPEPADDDFEF
jgi:single-strand DNA-binding protein